ncbi:MAG: hypothetical protein ACOX50_02695 [Patescibacteria group bacterium]|jgi:hypothetical protein
MNSNSKFIIIGVLAASLALLAGFGYQKIYSKPEKIENIVSQEKGAVRQVVEKYLQLVPFSGPPEVDETAIETMFSLLSKAGQERVSSGPGKSAGFAMMAGVQDLPDQGFDVQTVTVTGQTAEVETSWNYSGGMVLKKFQLVKEKGSWKIEDII